MKDTERDELLIRIDERLRTVQERLEKGDGRFSELEKRVSGLENFKFEILGAAAMVSFSISFILSVIRTKLGF